MGKPEGKVEDYLIKRCKDNNILCYKFTSPGRRGVPDRICIGRGTVLFLELKALNGTPSKWQERTVERIRNHGCYADFAYSKEQVDKKLLEYFGIPITN